MPILQPERYVIVWRETPSPSARLRTYTDSSDAPLAYAAEELSPSPSIMLTTPDELDRYLASAMTDPVAIPIQLARDVLGWEPVLPTFPSA